MHGLCSTCALFWALEEVGLEQPLLISARCLGTPMNVGVAWHFRPLLAPKEGRAKAGTYAFVPFVWGPPRTYGLRSTSALFWAPEQAGMRQPLLILSLCLGTPENAGVV